MPWSLAEENPILTCHDELSNALELQKHLCNMLSDLCNKYQDLGLGSTHTKGYICIQDSHILTQATDLDTIDTRLCQFNTCIQHLINTLRGTKLSENVSYLMLTCQIHLSSLRNTISKMKMQRTSSSTACNVTWSFNSKWSEIAKGPQLFQELLEYLKQLQFPCN
ncbi:hypothetical protein Y1Q_0012222 [Alligator mississippiensis]|uniref:Uncharacterized protein n=1 Tax=Alligator mississippiensis TaxID=8496 RepID=A0A151NVD8_ALLMI|nr:hypothetical protein Y1Q_0012222 [Alligator mississippiensis]